MNSPEKRRFKRLAVSTVAWIFDDNGVFIQGRTDNFSPGGTFIIAALPESKIKRGNTLKVKIGCPDDTGNSSVFQTVSGLTRVMRIENSNGKRGVALKFVSEPMLD